MPNRSSKKRPTDINELARFIVDVTTDELDKEISEEIQPQKSPAAVALGRLGGKARALKLSAKKRQAIARKAAQSRRKKESS